MATERRSPARLTAEMLGAVRGAGRAGMTNSELTAAVRVAGARVNKLARDLVSAGLFVRSDGLAGGRLTITPHGVEALCCYKDFLAMAESFGLEP